MSSDAAVREAVRDALSLHKARASSITRAIANRVIPLLVAELEGDETSGELCLLATAWIREPSVLGSRVRDLAVELARRVAVRNGWPVGIDHPE